MKYLSKFVVNIKKCVTAQRDFTHPVRYAATPLSRGELKRI